MKSGEAGITQGLGVSTDDLVSRHETTALVGMEPLQGTPNSPETQAAKDPHKGNCGPILSPAFSENHFVG